METFVVQKHDDSQWRLIGLPNDIVIPEGQSLGTFDDLPDVCKMISQRASSTTREESGGAASERV